MQLGFEACELLVHFSSHRRQFGPNLPKMAIFGVSGVPPLQFLGALKAQIDPPGCEIQCSTHLGQLEVSMARMTIFGPKMGSK